MTTPARPNRGMTCRSLVPGLLAWMLLSGPVGTLADARPGGPMATAIVEADGTAATLQLDVDSPAAVGDCGGQAGDCWTVGSLVTLSAAISVAGRSGTCSKRCRLPVTQDLTLDSGRYAWDPPLAAFCPRGGDFVLADSGTVTPGPRRKLLLVPDTQPDLESCIGNNAKFMSLVRPSPDNMKLSGHTAIHGRTTQPTNVGPARIAFTVRFDHFGIPTGSGTPTLPRAKDCGTTIVLRCAL